MYLSKKKKKPASIQIYISDNPKKRDYNINAKTIHTMVLLEQQQQNLIR